MTDLRCGTCTALLNEALNLTVRGRTLDGIQRRADQLACAEDGGEWLASGRFDRFVESHNCECDPWRHIETRSLTPQLWAEDQFQRDLHDWETRARKHLMEVNHD
jgi:hypothetical protein